MPTTSAERTVLVRSEKRLVIVEKKPNAADRTVIVNED